MLNVDYAENTLILRKIGRYEILSEIERGGMATVYYARDPIVDRYVALKTLPHTLIHETDSRIRFEREARIFAALEHPAIVPLYDFGQEEGKPFLVMRFMKGGSLGRRLRHKVFSLTEARNIFNRIAPAIDKVHQLKIVHRDLKPGNILFDEDDHPYVADFGIAKLAESSASISGDSLVGTLSYASPEHLQSGNAINSVSDIYALGVILFEMLTGDVPFKGASTMQHIRAILMDPVPKVSEFYSGLPPAVDTLIERAMAKNPKYRYQTAGEFADALALVVRSIEQADSDKKRATREISPAYLLIQTKALTPTSVPAMPGIAAHVKGKPFGGIPLRIWQMIGGLLLLLISAHAAKAISSSSQGLQTLTSQNISSLGSETFPTATPVGIFPAYSPTPTLLPLMITNNLQPTEAEPFIFSPPLIFTSSPTATQAFTPQSKPLPSSTPTPFLKPTEKKTEPPPLPTIAPP